MKEKIKRFKGYTIEPFWQTFVNNVYDSMTMAQVMCNGDLNQRQKIITFAAEMFYKLYEDIFLDKQEYLTWYNVVIMGILDYHEKDDIFNVNFDDMFDCIKKNWNKNLKMVMKYQ